MNLAHAASTRCTTIRSYPSIRAERRRRCGLARALSAIAALATCSTAITVARAAPVNADDGAAEEGSKSAQLAARDGMALPNQMAARMEPNQRVVAVGLAGYDAATATGIARMVADVNIFGPLDLRAGLTYLSDVGPYQNKFEPQLGLRLRLLNQETAGVDLATAISYRRDRYTQDTGLVQAVLAVGRRWGHLGVLGNVAFGSDLEGDDRDGELGVALLYEAALQLQVGLESHVRFDLGSNDPRRQLRGQGAYDLQAGPVLHCAIGPAILTAETGISAYQFEHTRAGVYALGGLAGVY
jgi:hypothetical protein